MMQREQKFGIGSVQKYLMQQHSNPDQFLCAIIEKIFLSKKITQD